MPVPLAYRRSKETRMLIDIIIVLSLLAIVVTTLVAVVTKVISARKNRVEKVVNGIPSGYITLGAIAFTLVVAVIAFLAMPADDMIINGEAYNDAFWLRTANMCIVTAGVLLVVSVLAMVLSKVVNRK